MRKFLLLLMVLCVVSNYSWSQRPRSNQYTITLNGNSISPQGNFAEVKEGMKAKYGKSATENLGWFIVQFNSIPTSQEKAQLKSQGIELLDYIQGYAYYASISKRFLSVDAKSQKNVRSLYTIKPEYKIETNLASGNIPDYAKNGDLVKVVITYFKNVDDATLAKGNPSVKMKEVIMAKRFYQIYAEVLPSQLIELASTGWIQSIEMVAPPAELENDHGKSLHRSNVLNSSIPGLGYGLTGKGVKIGLWDANVYNHRDFNGRVTVREYEMHTSSHGTHTCGTITGAGVIDPSARGMAPEATIYAWNFNIQSNGLNNAQERLISLDEDGIEITSNSFGSNVTSCPNPYAYGTSDRNEDLIAGWYPYFLYVYSAGNNQSVCPTGYFTTSKNMKNSLMVAAIDQNENMSSFSSFGPSKDGRLIPNISGDGVDTWSTYLDNGYGYMSGTSMATPGVAGTMALIYQRYKETHGGEQPLSALMRALACNTAHDLGNPGPDFKYGYGAINGLRAVEVMEQNTYFVNSVAQDGHFTTDITIPSGAVGLRVMLAWTDPAAVVGSPKILVNDLDLYLTKDGGAPINAWVLDPNNPSANAVRDWDGMNNLEQVTIDNPTPGTYTINVDGYQIPDGVQDFAVVYDIVMPTLKLTYPIGGETFNPGDLQVIRWDCEGYTNPFTLEYSSDGGVNYTIVASNIPSNVRSFTFAVPNDVKPNVKFRISNGSALSVNKGNVMVMTVPQNVMVGQAQCGGAGPFTLQWDAVANANYEVLKLNGQVYEHLADVTTNSYDITNIVQDNNNWYCVRAIDKTNGAISERSLAVTVNPAVAVAALPFTEKFESQKADNFYFTGIKGQGNVRYVNNSQKYGIRLEGTSGPTTDWVAGADAACFTNNPTYVVSASICNIDASTITGPFRLKFDYRQKYRTAAGTSYFRVKVNGDYLTNTDGTQIYGATNQVSYKSVYYDLSAYAGLSNVTIVFEAVCKTNYTTYINSSGNYDFSNDTYDVGDFVCIDNIEVLKPLEDMALTSLTVSSGLTATETVTVKVKNLSGASVSDVPVSYQINDGTVVNETIAGPIAPMAEATYVFTQNADFSVGGYYLVKASVNWATDPVATNNSLTVAKANNGTDILIGTGSPTTTCDAWLVDPSGRFADYATSQSKTHQLIPSGAGKNVKITFTEFATELDWDFVYVYNGNSTAAGDLLGKFSGNSIPAPITSSAPSGELTIKFTSDVAINDIGFVAHIECVDKPALDAAVTAITAPTASSIKTTTETVSFTLFNYGTAAITTYDMYYQVDENTPVMQSVTTDNIASGASLTKSFDTKVDLSTPGTYSLKVWVVLTGDEIVANDSKTVSIVSIPSTADAGISAISTIYPNRLTTSTITATIKNFGTTSLSNIDVAYTINGGAEVVQTVAGPIVPGATANISFTTKADLTTPGTTYTIDVYTKLAGDILATNDKMTSAVTTPTNSATNVVGTFSNGTSIITSSNTTQFSLTNNFTVEMWLKPNQNPKYGTVFSKGVSITHHSEYYPAQYGSNCLIISLTGQTYLTPSNSITNDEWQHVAVTSAADGTIKVYINGIQQTLANTAKATQNANLSTPVRLGSNSSLSQPYYGAMDEVRIWNSELSQATIQANMMTDYAANTAGMLAYYKFKEGSGVYAYDYSSNDNTAIISGANVNGMGAGKFWNEPGALLRDFNFTGEKVPTTFDANSNTFTSIMDAADLSALTANFTSVQQSVIKIGTDIQTSGMVKDFTSGTKTYTAEGFGFNAGITQTYTVNVSNDLSSACDLISYSFETVDNPSLSSSITLDANGNNFYKKVGGVDVSALKATFQISAGAKLLINGVEQTNPQAAAVDYSKPLMVTVMAENGRIFKNYSIDVDVRSNAASLTAFNILNEQVGTTEIDETNHTIGIWVKKSSNLAMLTPTFSISPNSKLYLGSIVQRNGITTNNFENPLVYMLVSEDETNLVNWTVNVAPDLTVPVITLTGNATVEMTYGTNYSDAGATATDNIDGNITSSIVVTGLPTNTSPVGAYTVTYNVKDAAGNDAVAVTRTVNVVKATATINITNTTQAYDGAAKSVTATTTPAGLTVNITYDGSATAPTNVGTYAVVATINDANYQGTQNATLTISKAAATIEITNIAATYDGTAKSVTATTTPAGLTVNVTYDGSATAPTNAGTYAVVATIDDATYQGTQNATLTISKASATIEITNIAATYDGTAKSVTATTTPAGLTVNVTYDGAATAPINAGSYAVVATINDANYQGTQNATLNISKASATIEITNITATYDGTAKSVTATTTPAGITVNVTYDGAATAPINAGSYAVVATINDANYQGTQNATLTINKAAATITFGNTTQPFDGSAKPVTTTTDPTGLTVVVKYTGTNVNYPESTTAPSAAGTYSVTATIDDANYAGTNTSTLTITPGTGVDPVEISTAKIYSDSKTIYVELPEIRSSAKIIIYNIIGNQVYLNENPIQGVNRIDENLMVGNYIVKVIVDQKIKTEKVVITK